MNAVIEAENECQARNRFIDEWFINEKSEDYDILIEEASIDELLKIEQDMLHQRLINKYLFEQKGDMSINELYTLVSNVDNDEMKTMLYKMTKLHLKRLRMSEYLENRIDTSKLSHLEFCRLRDMLCNAKSQEEISKINRELTAKYGKAY